MNKNKVKNRSLISRFSSSLLGRGKKAEGHKTFFNFLLFLKVNAERDLLNLNLQRDMLKTLVSNTSIVYFLRSIGFHENVLQKTIPKNEKAFHIIAKDFSKDGKKITKQQRMQDDNFQGKALIVHSDLLSRQAFSSKTLCKISINNVKPILETRKVRKGRITYRIPLVTRTERQEGKAISWLVAGASSRRNKLKTGQGDTFLGTSVPLSLAKPLVKEKAVSTKNEEPLLLKAKKSPSALVVSKKEKRLPLKLKHVKGVLSLVENKKKDFRSLQYCLAQSFLEASQGKGDSVEKRKEFHQLALQNRAYTHYRWW